MKFNWEDFKNSNGKIAVHCKTEAEAEEFIKQCYKHGIKWRYCNENDTNWENVNKEIYYECDGEYIYYEKLNKIPVVKYKEDNKMELEEGMIIECRNKNRYLLRKVNDMLIGSNFDGWIKAMYDENLCENHYHDETFDIIKIYKPKVYTLANLFDDKYLICIWERKEPKKMTLAQISEALGYEVEVIDNE